MKTYIESQRFSSIVLFLIASLAIFLTGITVWQLFSGHKVGAHPAPDFVNILLTLFALSLALIFFSARLETRIDQEGLTYHFSGLWGGGGQTKWSEVSHIEFMKCPYLGEGARDWNRKNASAYVTRGGGNMGIMIYRKNSNRNIFISTKQPSELKEFLKSNTPEGIDIVQAN